MLFSFQVEKNVKGIFWYLVINNKNISSTTSFIVIFDYGFCFEDGTATTVSLEVNVIDKKLEIHRCIFEKC